MYLYRTKLSKEGINVTEHKGLVTMMGNPITLLGNDVQIGVPAPNFEVIDNGMKPVKFSSFKNKVTVISSVPSLDTSVCDIETRRFNQIASQLGDAVQIIAISMDLPFAQTRWCGAAGVEKVTTYSDHREASFGLAYGVLMKDIRLLARAVFVVDTKGILRYIQLVSEIANEPNYDEVLFEVKKLI